MCMCQFDVSEIVLTTAQVLAEYEKDDVRLEVEVTIPHSYPLRNIQVSSDRHVGVSKGKWKTWVFQMMGTMFSQVRTVDLTV